MIALTMTFSEAGSNAAHHAVEHPSDFELLAVATRYAVDASGPGAMSVSNLVHSAIEANHHIDEAAYAAEMPAPEVVPEPVPAAPEKPSLIRRGLRAVGHAAVFLFDTANYQH